MLKNTIEINVRFNDTDPLAIVWHGNYVQYMEDGREAFGEKYGCGYLEIHRLGYVVPIVNVNIDYKLPIGFGEKAIVETEFVNSAAAKIIFNYKIFRSSDGKLAATGQTTQVFLNKDTHELELNTPLFFQKLKQSWGLYQ